MKILSRLFYFRAVLFSAGFSLLFSIVCLSASVSWANTYQVLNSISQPQALILDQKKINQKINLVQKMVLNQDFKLKTNSKQFVRFLLNESYEISVFNDSEISVESIYTSEGLKSLSVQIEAGQVYILKLQNIKTTTVTTPLRFRLASDFFQWDAEQNHMDLNLWIKLDKKKPSIEFCNREKTFEISLFDHEKKINLEASEGVIFEGQNQDHQSDSKDNKVDFDILLKGRKIPKGHWLEKNKCSFSEIKELEKNILNAEQLEKNKSAAVIKKNQLEKNRQDAKFLCQNPYGQLNDCAWIQVGSKCQRTRCNAEGKWSDSQFVFVEKSKMCSKKYFVSTCDY